MILKSFIFERCHAKTGLKIFVVVMPKEGLAGICPTKPCFGMTLTVELYSFVFTDYILLLPPALAEEVMFLVPSMCLCVSVSVCLFPL